MDPFQILIRSTSLQKKGWERSQFEQLIPSAGAPVNPQTLSNGSSANKAERAMPTGEKRKRDDELSDEQQVSNQGADGGEPSKQPKSEEECRRILRSHKIKVTVLDQDPPAKKRKGNLENASESRSKEKSAQTQLYSQTLEHFRDLRQKFNISRRLADNLADNGYYIPTEVQLAAIPLLLGTDKDRGVTSFKSQKNQDQESNIDLLTVAQTGSGKTLAYLIPTIQSILNSRHRSGGGDVGEKDHVRAIILAPTHELVDQIVSEARRLCAGTGIRAAAMQKGMRLSQSQNQQLGSEEPKTEPIVKTDILVGTPLALLNSLTPTPESESERLLHIQHLILDEADALLDPLFREQTLGVWSSCTSSTLQVTLWSATIGSSIENLAQETIRSRRKTLSQTTSSTPQFLLRIVAGLKDSALPTISHKLIYCATEQGKLLALRQILHPPPSTTNPNNSLSSSLSTSTTIPILRPPFLIFTQSIPRATALYSELLYDIPLEAGGPSRIAALHASLSDSARADIMARFRKGEVWVLITTDLLARGMDFRGVNGVVNYDIPTTSAGYIHRAGRTGRAGREGGLSVVLYTKEDIKYVKGVANVIKASEKARGKGKEDGNVNVEGGGEGAVPKWLLEALPDVSKKSRKELKTRGVEARRVGGGKEGGKGEARTRISTKSGWERREEDRKRGAIEGSKRRKKREVEREMGVGEEGEGEEWSGFGD